MKLLLADDHNLFRDALVEYIIRADPQAEIAVAKDYHEAIEIMDKDPAQDLVLLDLTMPGMNGMKSFSDFRTKYPDVPLSLMSGTAEPEHVNEAIELGAVGYFPKTLSGKALVSAIQLVLNGERFIPIDNVTHAVVSSYKSDPGISPLGQMAGQMKQDNIPNHDINLTPKEAEVLTHLAKGATNKHIADELNVQVVTVKLHVRGICRKLEVANRTQAALKAKELGLVS